MGNLLKILTRRNAYQSSTTHLWTQVTANELLIRLQARGLSYKKAITSWTRSSLFTCTGSLVVVNHI